MWLVGGGREFFLTTDLLKFVHNICSVLAIHRPRCDVKGGSRDTDKLEF